MPEQRGRLAYCVALASGMVTILAFLGVREVRDLLRWRDDVRAQDIPQGLDGPIIEFDGTLAEDGESALSPRLITDEINLAGLWSGYATAGSRRFEYQWQVSQAADRVWGIIMISQSDCPSQASYKFGGHVASGRLIFYGTEFIENGSNSCATWCKASGRLLLSTFAGEDQVLQGTWGALGVRGGCAQGTGGRIWLRRVSEG